MAFAHTAGDSSWPIHLYDDEDEYEIYLKTGPENIKEEDIEVLLVNENLGDAENLVISWGAARRGWRINNCLMVLSSASGDGGWIELIKAAKQYWSVNQSSVTLVIKDNNGYNQAQIPNAAGTDVEPATVQFIEYRRGDDDGVNAKISIGVIAT